MRLDLRELIVNPELRLPFRAELETDRLSSFTGVLLTTSVLILPI